MKLGDQLIVTPLDNPCQYQPDWRSYVAMALADGRGARLPSDYAEYAEDPWIRKQAEYAKIAAAGRRIPRRLKPLHTANVWSKGTRPSDVRYRLEPLLLTAASMNVIALDIGGGVVDAEAFVAYERLFFNVRLDDGRLHPSCQLRQYFALPTGEFDENTPQEQIWKMIGALMGYDTLTSVWLWKDAHGRKDDSQETMLDEMWRVAQSRVFMSMFEDRIGHESMAKLLSALTSQTKMIHDSKESGDVGLDTTRTLMAILYKASPQVIGAAKAVDAQATMMRSIRDTLAAEANVARTELPEAGPAAAAAANDEINRVLQGQFKD